MITKFEEFIMESVRIQIQDEELFSKAKAKIERHLKQHKCCKVGKTADIKARFDTSYREAGYENLIPILRVCLKIDR